MILRKLLDGVEYELLCGDKDVYVDNVKHNATDIEKGDIFICLHSDDECFKNINLAICNGAKVVIMDKYIAFDYPSVTYIKVDDIRKSYAIIASNYYHNVSKNIKIIGVVGTNGKSTTAHIIYSLLLHLKEKVGFIGTGKYMIQERVYEQNFTTPDPMNLHNILYNMQKSGVKVVVMEVSAHAIYLKKVYGINFEIGIFTNLSQDHLDYFYTMDNLRKVKESFFLDNYPRMAVVNIDDKVGDSLKNKCYMPTFSYSLHNKNADIFVDDINFSNGLMCYSVHIQNRVYHIKSRLYGEYNISNMIAGILAVKLLGKSMTTLVECAEKVQPLSGRLNIIEYEKVRYIVDYAHSPDGLKNVLLECKKFTKGRVILVFGAGGDRDKSKRCLMGEVACRYADIVIITSDNPRSEKAMDIIKDIYRGVNRENDIYLVENRKNAIMLAHSYARENDTILIAGKGDEGYIEENGQKYSYSDKHTVEELLGILWI